MTYGNHYEMLVDRLRDSTLRIENHADRVSKSTNHRPPEYTRPFGYTVSVASRERKKYTLRNRLLKLSRWKSPTDTYDEHPGATGHLSTVSASDASSSGDVDGVATMTSATAQPGGTRGCIHWTLSRGFASGALVPSSLPEMLLCQAYYNPAIIMIVEALLDPKALQDNNQGGKRNTFPEDDSDEQPEPSGGGSGEGGASFLAQIAAPKKFFTKAMLSGTRPNFQVHRDGELESARCCDFFRYKIVLAVPWVKRRKKNSVSQIKHPHWRRTAGLEFYFFVTDM